MRKSLLLGLVLTIFFNLLYGQREPVVLPNGQLSSQIYREDDLLLPFPKSDYSQIVGLRSDKLREVYNAKSNTKVDGSPYLYESWNNGSKIYYKDKIYSLESLNYNIYADQFEAKISSDTVFVFNSENVKKVVIKNKVFTRYHRLDSQNNGYYEELVDFDGYRILRKYNTKIKDGATNPLTKIKLSNDELIKFETYYIFNMNNDSLIEIKLKKSTFEVLFEKNKLNELNKFIKGNNLKYNEINDIVRIIGHYNSL